MKRMILLSYQNLALFLVLFLVINVLVLAILIVERKFHYAEVVDQELQNAESLVGGVVRELDVSPEKMAQLMSTPSTRPHPYLIVTEGMSQEHYEIGLEGIRYENGWDDNTVSEMLNEGSTFVFGGSTTFGHGVEGNQVFSARLNKLDPEGRYLNFGIQSYDNVHEFRKLIYLLLKGWRPKRVIFLDGLNDVSANTQDPRLEYHIDSNRNRDYLCGGNWHRRSTGYPGKPTKQGMMRAFLDSLPVYHLAIKYWGTAPRSPNDTSSAFDPNRMMWDPCTPLDFPTSDAVIDQQFEKYVFHFQQFDRMMQALAESYGFDYFLFFQPIGCIDSGNKFSCGDDSVTRRFDRFAANTQKAIKAQALPMKDVSRCLLDDPALLGKSYVDGTHYSVAGHDRLAMCMYEAMGSGA